MANVNPPPALRMPRIILEDREWRDYERNRDVILFQLWQRTGGNIDQIENSKNNITSTSSRVNRNTARINSLELRQFEIVNTINSLTTKDYQVIICKNAVPISITLDPQAIEADEVHIKRRGVSVEVIGTIDGFTNKTISSLNYSMHLIFDGTDWSEI
jgi:hypothetical protein|tara:strand:+ start:1764 stop:2237 length:474 start_codon:yes stop_codon:yes gene_type:complete